MPRVLTQCRALSCLGIVVVCLQLVVIYLLSQHTSTTNRPEPAAARLASSSSSNNRIQSSRNETTIRQRTYPASGGSFNGIPIYYKEEPLEYSTISCVGENFQSDAHMYRSCQFRHFCFDIEEKEFVITQSPQEQAWLSSFNSSSLITSAVDTNISVSLGGVNLKWGKDPFEQLKWFPRILRSDEPITDGYYQLPDDYVWVPYHSMAGFNIGHLVWDDGLPIYTLLSMFGLENNKTPLLMRYVLKQGPLWATCDWNDDMKTKCNNLIRSKFLPLMGVVDGSTFSTTEDFRFQPSTVKSKYVCARYGAAGIGMLSDHGQKTHGWQPRDYETTHNVGRGGALYAFRNFMTNNLLGSSTTAPPLSSEPPFHILFSVKSSESGARNLSFEQQIQALETNFSSNNETTQIHAHVLKTLSLKEQVELTSKTAIFVTSAGGGAVTATFLPRGASLIIYYQSDGSRVHMKKTGGPARLDWDLFNHASYLKVHWLPVKDMNTPQGLEILVDLIRNELHALSRG